MEFSNTSIMIKSDAYMRDRPPYKKGEASGVTICYLNAKASIPKPQQAANASLLLTAPKMLAALRIIYELKFELADQRKKTANHKKAVFEQVMSIVEKTIYEAESEIIWQEE